MSAATLGSDLAISREQHGLHAEKYIHLFEIDANDCWIWQGRKRDTGYGLAGRTYAHRFFYELLVAEIPPGFHVDHLCRVHECVNPDHLEAVTPRENILRGEGWAAKRAAQTHCNRGHAFTAANTRATATGRRCITCHRAAAAAQYAATKAVSA